MESEGAASSGIVTAIEREYALRARHPERDEVYRGFAARSAAYRASVAASLNLRYGEGERCVLDFFPALDNYAPPLLVFIHGGYWRALDKDIFSFIAAPYNAAGAAVALIGYELAPSVTITQIAASARAAIAWLGAHATGLPGVSFDPHRVIVSGHSAGGHLAALLSAADAGALGGVTIQSVIGLSGLYDLEPLLATSINLDVRMSLDEAIALSPINARRFNSRRFLLAVGNLETQGFIEQSRRFAAHLASVGYDTEFMSVPDRTHFDLLDDFAAPNAALYHATLKLLQAPPA